MEFRILGTLEIRDGAGQLLAPPRRKQRLLLAVLLLRANTPVSTESLLGLLWPEAAPPSARANLQSYVSDLRRLLHADEPANPPRLLWASGGYTLRAGPEELDATVFEKLVGEGQQALAEQRHALAAERLAQALARWRGPVLEDLPLPAALQPEVERLEELRMMVLEDSIEARLGLAEPAVHAADLATLTARYPLRERLWAHLMLALYRAGRQADALGAYQRIYRLLDQELGVRPGQALQQRHRQILAADPTLDAPAGRGKTDLPVPRQLPAGVGDFTGRAEILDRLDTLLPSAPGVAPTAVVISAIAGGSLPEARSLLAELCHAHLLTERAPAGSAFTTCCGRTPPSSPMSTTPTPSGTRQCTGSLTTTWAPPTRRPSCSTRTGTIRLCSRHPRPASHPRTSSTTGMRRPGSPPNGPPSSPPSTSPPAAGSTPTPAADVGACRLPRPHRPLARMGFHPARRSGGRRAAG
jgi:DNA-binding SARP family transcriptional activator